LPLCATPHSQVGREYGKGIVLSLDDSACQCGDERHVTAQAVKLGDYKRGAVDAAKLKAADSCGRPLSVPDSTSVKPAITRRPARNAWTADF
jgi:hypothetical protein